MRNDYFYLPIDLKFDEFDWPCWGVDSDWYLRRIAVREQKYNQKQPQIKHSFQYKYISARQLHQAKKTLGTFLSLGRYASLLFNNRPQISKVKATSWIKCCSSFLWCLLISSALLFSDKIIDVLLQRLQPENWLPAKKASKLFPGIKIRSHWRVKLN